MKKEIQQKQQRKQQKVVQFETEPQYMFKDSLRMLFPSSKGNNFPRPNLNLKAKINLSQHLHVPELSPNRLTEYKIFKGFTCGNSHQINV